MKRGFAALCCAGVAAAVIGCQSGENAGPVAGSNDGPSDVAVELPGGGESLTLVKLKVPNMT